MNSEHIHQALIDLMATNGWECDYIPDEDVIQVFVDDWSFDLRVENLDVI